jgi:hypothetical protein
MFSAVSVESADRIRQAALQLVYAKKLEEKKEDIDSTLEELIRIQKGLIFVSLYSAIEFTLTSSVSQFLTAIQRNPKKPFEYKKYLLCTVMNAEFNAIIDCSKKTVWKNKAKLMDCLFSDDPVNIDNAVFPTDGTNISHNQISEIWRLFHLPNPILPDGVHPWLLNEIKEHRNAIAHGRERAATIGGRFSVELLEKRHESVALLCAHIVSSFEEHFKSKAFLRDAV